MMNILIRITCTFNWYENASIFPAKWARRAWVSGCRSRGLGAFDQNVQGLRVLQNFGEHLSLLQAPKKKLALANAASHLVSWNPRCVYASCMVYEPTFGWFLGKMVVYKYTINSHHLPRVWKSLTGSLSSLSSTSLWFSSSSSSASSSSLVWSSSFSNRILENWFKMHSSSTLGCTNSSNRILTNRCKMHSSSNLLEQTTLRES